MSTGANIFLTCETAEGRQTFATPSDAEPFRTPDGRWAPGRMTGNMTPEQYHAEIIQTLIVGRANDLGAGQLGDEAGTLITQMIGANALGEDEMRNVLSIVRAAFAKPDSIVETLYGCF